MGKIKYTGVCILIENIALIMARISFYIFFLTVICDLFFDMSDGVRDLGLLMIYGLWGIPICFGLSAIRQIIEFFTNKTKPLFVFGSDSVLIYTGVNTKILSISKNIRDIFITSISNLFNRGAVNISYDKITTLNISDKTLKFKSSSINEVFFSIFLENYSNKEIDELIPEFENHHIKTIYARTSDNIESKSGKIVLRDKSLTYTHPKKSSMNFMLPYKNIFYAHLTEDKVLYFYGFNTQILQKTDVSGFHHNDLQSLLDKLNNKLALLIDWQIAEKEELFVPKSSYTIPDDEILEKEVKFGRTEGVIKIFYDNKQLKSESPYKDGKIDGLYKEYFESGSLKSEIEFNKGIQGNLSKTYYESGKLRSELLDGKTAKNKVVKEYYENGSLKRETYYNNKKLDGVAIWYYENGNIQESITLKNDKTIGCYKTFYINGKLEKELNYADGNFLFGDLSIDKRNNKMIIEHNLPKDRKILYINNSNEPQCIGKMDGIQKWYYENGTLKSESTYKNDKIDGVYKEFYDNKQLKSVEFYINGIQSGKAEKYYKNGKLKQEADYKDDYPVGIEKEYYENGSIKRETLYKSKKKNGLEKQYYETGEVQYERYFVDGKLDGEVKEYYKDGKIKSKEYYNNGVSKDVSPTNTKIPSQSILNTNIDIMASRRKRNIISSKPLSNNNADTDNRNIDL